MYSASKSHDAILIFSWSSFAQVWIKIFNLVEKLPQFGFCKEYHEILRYEKNVALISEKRELFIHGNQADEVAADSLFAPVYSLWMQS